MTSIRGKFGINTYSYTQSMRAADCLRRLAGEGVTTFELMFYPGHLWITDDAAAFREVRQIIDDGGLQLVSMNGPNVDLNIAAATQEMRALSIELNTAYIRMAGELGARGLILGPGKPNPLFPLPADILEGHFFAALDKLCPVAATCGIELWVENMPFAFMPEATRLMASLDRYGSDALKICYDVANAHFIGEDPVAGLSTVAPRLAVVHVSDTTRGTYRHDPVGDGDIDFARLPRAIADVGYDRSVVLEVISRNADADNFRSMDALAEAGF